MRIEISRILHNSFAITWENSWSHDFSANTENQLVYIERTLDDINDIFGHSCILIFFSLQKVLHSNIHNQFSQMLIVPVSIVKCMFLSLVQYKVLLFLTVYRTGLAYFGLQLDRDCVQFDIK